LDRNPSYQNKTQHIVFKYHFVRHVVEGGGVGLYKVQTHENCAEIFKKTVPLEKMWWCLASLGLKKKGWMGLGKVIGKLL